MNGFRGFSAFLAQISQKLKIRFLRKLRTYVNFSEQKIKTYISHLHFCPSFFRHTSTMIAMAFLLPGFDIFGISLYSIFISSFGTMSGN